MKVIKYALAVVFIAGALFCALFFWAAFGDHPESGTHCAHVDWLPDTASDISYYRNPNIGNNRAYEFRMSLENFLAYAAKQKWAVQPFSGEASVRRHTYFGQHPGDSADMRNIRIRSTDGLFYEKRYANGGGVTVLYDKPSGIAYINESSR